MVSAAMKENQGTLRRAASGAAFVPRGLLYFARNPWTWPLGAVPVLLAVVAIVGLIALSWLGVAVLFAWVTRLAQSLAGHGAAPSTVSAIAVGIAIVAGSLVSLLGVLAFAEFVKAIGQPFWQVMCDRLEQKLGIPPPPSAEGGFTRVMKATRDTIIVVAIYLAIALPILVFGFVPVVGQTVIPAVEALLAAWLIAVELTQIPLERRGLTVLARHRFLRAHQAETLGFGLASLLLFLIPGANVIAVPGAVIGGTLFIRHLEGRAS